MTRSRELAELASAYDSGSPFGMKNRIINGDFRIDQRNAGASVTVSTDNVFAVDRFSSNKGGSITNYTAQRSSTAPSGFNNSLLATMGTGVTPGASDYAMLSHKIEGFNTADLGLGTANAVPFMLSFWVRSSVTGTFGVSFRNAAANAAYCATYAINAANTWEYKTVAVPVITSGTWTTDNSAGVMVAWDLGVGSTFSGTANQLNTGANYFGVSGTTKLAATSGATFYITGVQLEAGSVATPFERRAYGQELALCQRYYWQSDTISSGSLLIDSYSNVAGAQLVSCIIASLPVSMRSTPTIAVPAGSVLNITSNSWALRGGVIFATGSYSGAGRAYYQTSANGVISAVSEL